MDDNFQEQDPIDAWWSAFAAMTDDLTALFSQRAEWDLPEWMHEYLGAIHPQLMWEYGPAIITDGHRLVITPESRRDLRPLVDEILSRAPKIEGWEFYGHRPPEDIEMARKTVEVRTGGDIGDTRVLATIGEFNRIDLVFVSPRYSEDNEQAFNDVIVATETLLGEEALDKWIGAIQVAKLSPQKHANAQPIKNLKASVDFLISDIQATLPRQPYYRTVEDDQEWTLWELEPQQADDYLTQMDIFVGKSMLPPMWQNAHSPVSFDSVRFSRCGEIFCYVKLDGSEGLDADKFGDKSEIEDALDAALRQAEVGCVVGGSTGLKYSYVDFALADVDRGVSIVQKILRDGHIHKRSWVLFYDTDYEARWIGIWGDSPQPPMPEFEK